MLHTELQIYKSAFDLLGVAVEVIRNMPRYMKKAIGTPLRDECLAVLTLICRANRSDDKVAPLTELNERLQNAEVLLRLSVDRKYIPRGHYAKAIELSSSVGKQANGWRKHFANAPAPEGQGSQTNALF